MHPLMKGVIPLYESNLILCIKCSLDLLIKCSSLILQIHRYMLMSPSIQQMRSYTWLKRHLPPTVVLQVRNGIW